MSALFATKGLSVHYGGVAAVVDVDIEVGKGEIVGLIGPNGAGKSSFIDGVTGFTPCSGEIWLDGREISSLAPHRRARRGLARTWQAGELFEDLSIAENLAVAADHRTAWGLLTRRSGRPRENAGLGRVLDLLGLSTLAGLPPDRLSQGQRKLVGVGRALVSDPHVLLLDEPAAGLDTDESISFGETLKMVAATGPGVLLVDHDMGLILSICDRVVVLESGSLLAQGKPEEIRRNPAVMRAYLGTSESVEAL